MISLLTKLKAYASVIVSVTIAILTLGAYARYQKHRADSATIKAKEADEIYKQIKKQITRNNEARKKAQESREGLEKRKNERTYFGD